MLNEYISKIKDRSLTYEESCMLDEYLYNDLTKIYELDVEDIAYIINTSNSKLSLYKEKPTQIVNFNIKSYRIEETNGLFFQSGEETFSNQLKNPTKLSDFRL